MSSALYLAIFLLFIGSTFGAHVEDTRIIIGSSVGGVLGLVKTNARTVSFD